MKILLANDDGIDAVGIRILIKYLAVEHELYVVAPDQERSGASHSVHYYHTDLIASPRSIPGVKEAYACSGTPADCVYAALCGLFDVPFDLVVSGINHGWNVSTDILYSGTVGAAQEGLILGVPSMAVSLKGNSVSGYEEAARVAACLIPQYLMDEDRHRYLLNVNCPDGVRNAPLLLTQMDGARDYRRPLSVHEENGNKILHCQNTAIPLLEQVEGIKGDVTAVEEGYVSVTPLNLNLTDADRNTNTENIIKCSVNI